MSLGTKLRKTASLCTRIPWQNTAAISQTLSSRSLGKPATHPSGFQVWTESPPPHPHPRPPASISVFDSSRTKSLSRNALTQKGSLSFDRYGDQTATGTAGPLRTELNGTFLSTLSNELVNTYEISSVLRISLLVQQTRKRLESSVLVHPGLLQWRRTCWLWPLTFKLFWLGRGDPRVSWLSSSWVPLSSVGVGNPFRTVCSAPSRACLCCLSKR